MSNLQVQLSVIDNMTSSLRRVEGEIQNFSTRTRKQFSSFAKKAATSVAGFFAVGAIRNFANETAELYKAQAKADAKLQQVLKSTRNAAGLTYAELKTMASGLQDVTTIGDETTQQAQALLLTFTKIGRDVFPAATETVLNMSEAFDQGIKQSAIQLGKALNDPIRGVTALRRVGVQLTEQQEEQIRKFQEMGDIASAQKVILGELETQVGGMARALSDTEFGRLEQQKNTLGDIKETLGKEVIPLQTQWAEAQITLTRWTLKASDAYTSIVEKLGVLASGTDGANYQVQKSIENALSELDKNKSKKTLEDRRLEKLKEIKKQEEYIAGIRAEMNTALENEFYDAVAKWGDVLEKEKQDLQELEGHALLYADAIDKINKKIEANKKISGGGGSGVGGRGENNGGSGKTSQSSKVPKNTTGPIFGPETPAWLEAADELSNRIANYQKDMWAKQIEEKKKHAEALLEIDEFLAGEQIAAIEDPYERQIEMTRQKYAEMLDIAKQYNIDTAKLQQAKEEQERRTNERRAEAQKRNSEYVTDNVLSGLKAMTEGQKEYAAISKAIDIGHTIRSTYRTAQSVAEAAMDALPYPANLIAAIASAGVVTAAGLFNVSQIISSEYASGTNYAPSGMALVGERGPEIINMPRGAQVINNRETKEYIGGNNTMVLQVTDTSGTITRQIEREIRNGGADDLVRLFQDRLRRI